MQAPRPRVRAASCKAPMWPMWWPSTSDDGWPFGPDPSAGTFAADCGAFPGSYSRCFHQQEEDGSPYAVAPIWSSVPSLWKGPPSTSARWSVDRELDLSVAHRAPATTAASPCPLTRRTHDVANPPSPCLRHARTEEGIGDGRLCGAPRRGCPSVCPASSPEEGSPGSTGQCGGHAPESESVRNWA